MSEIEIVSNHDYWKNHKRIHKVVCRRNNLNKYKHAITNVPALNHFSKHWNCFHIPFDKSITCGLKQSQNIWFFSSGIVYRVSADRPPSCITRSYNDHQSMESACLLQLVRPFFNRVSHTKSTSTPSLRGSALIPQKRKTTQSLGNVGCLVHKSIRRSLMNLCCTFEWGQNTVILKGCFLLCRHILKKMFGMEQRSFKGKSYELLLLFFQRMASLLKYCHGLNHKISFLLLCWRDYPQDLICHFYFM